MGHSEVLDALIRAGAAVDVCDEDEKTPLHVAASGAISERLIAAGAKVHAGDECRAPILEAVEEDRVDVVRVLIKHGVAERSDGQGMLLAWAAFYGRIEVVKVLLEAEIRPSAPVPFGGETALHVVAGGSLADMSCPEHVTPHDRFEIARILIAAGAEVNAAANRGYFRGSTPLHAAARRGHAAMVALLLEHGADVGAAPADGHFAGYTALHGAAKGGHREVIMRLLAASADVNATTGEEYHGGICTPLDLAKTPEVRDLLVERGGKSARELGAAD